MYTVHLPLFTNVLRRDRSVSTTTHKAKVYTIIPAECQQQRRIFFTESVKSFMGVQRLYVAQSGAAAQVLHVRDRATS